MITNISQLDLNGTYSYADYLTWQLDGYVEIIKGKIYRMSPAPSRRHQRVAAQLVFAMMKFFEHHPCDVYFAPFDVRLPDSRQKAKGNPQILTVVQPDICVVCDQSKLDDAGCLGAPDWIIEILSTGTKQKDRKEKMTLYQENGVREYWIVSPTDEDVAVYSLGEDGKYQLKGLYSDEDIVPSCAFPGLEVHLPAIFSM